MTKRILILSVSVGAGHMRAAEAVHLALSDLNKNVYVKNQDVLQMATKGFRRVYAKAYMDMVCKTPHIVGYFYDVLNRDKAVTQVPVLLLAEKLNLRPFLKMLRAGPWDLIVNTHYLPASIVASLKKKKQLNIPQVTVTTDFETHRFWVNQPCEHYFTATREGALYLEHWGVPQADISVTGIPVHPVFKKTKPRETCLKQFGLEGKRPIILQISGGFGTGPVKKILSGLLNIKRPAEIVVVTGKNAEIKKELEKIMQPEQHRLNIIGFTDKIDELMQVADIVVTKPGGLTTAEVLAKGAVMVIVNPTPGQEDRNSDFLLENGAAIKINNPATMGFRIEELLGSPGRMKYLKQNSKKLGRPWAAYEIAKKILQYVP